MPGVEKYELCSSSTSLALLFSRLLLGQIGAVASDLVCLFFRCPTLQPLRIGCFFDNPWLTKHCQRLANSFLGVSDDEIYFKKTRVESCHTGRNTSARWIKYIKVRIAIIKFKNLAGAM